MAKLPHIMVDAFPLVDDHFSGVGHYTLGIVSGLDELAGEGKLTYSLIAPRHWTDRLNKYGLEHYKRIIANPVPNRIIRGFMKFQWDVPLDFILGQGNYYFPSFLAWPTWKADSTVVVHDVTYLAVPECVDKGNRDYLAEVVPFSLKNAKNIIAVSQFSKDEIVKYYKLDPKLISVAHPSIDRKHFYRRSAEEIHSVKARYDIFSEKYMFAVGNIEPRKNYKRLVEAYVKLPRHITNEYPLVIVGAGGWNNDDIKTAIQKAKEDGYKIINPKQFVLDADIPALYSGASFFVSAPVYEGFGMPPLEAYACGTPVITSNVASLPEAAGDAAVYVDPYDVDDIRQKIEHMVKVVEKDPHHFDAAMEKHLQSLNWRTSAEITAAALTGKPLEYFRKETTV
ncbi:glycosyltransferase family 4 protein [Candidatus Saccharibacteria bacterium]|nr:glycosyltransferase family 4 protein [Candidatus Saccharibacteria bacterium]